MKGEVMEKKYTDLSPSEVEYILVKTTSGGPIEEDLFFLIFSKEGAFQVPNSRGDEFLDWLKRFPDVNLRRFIDSMSCAEDRLFVLYRGPNIPVLSERLEKAMKERLLSLLKTNFDGSQDDLAKIAEKIFARYGETHRHYHNLEHILSSLWELDRLPETGIDKISIELAIWYHDLIYSPLSKTNEQDSAEELKKDLGQMKTGLDLEKVSRMILCTPETVRQRELSTSEQYFLDIDYSVLGQREIEYDVYKQNVRQEYLAVPSAIYHLKRKAFLKSNLRRSIYQTRWFRELYEEQAKRNIRSELSRMPYKLLPTLPWHAG